MSVGRAARAGHPRPAGRAAHRHPVLVGQGLAARRRGGGVRRGRPARRPHPRPRAARSAASASRRVGARRRRARATTPGPPRSTVPVLADEERRALVEVVAAEAGRVAALLAGELPFDLVEHAEEAGVELLPYGGELAATLHLRRLPRPVPARARGAASRPAGWSTPTRWCCSRCAGSTARRCWRRSTSDRPAARP